MVEHGLYSNLEESSYSCMTPGSTKRNTSELICRSAPAHHWPLSSFGKYSLLVKTS